MRKLKVEDLKNLVGRQEQCLSVYIPLNGNRQQDYDKINQVISTAFAQARSLFPESESVFNTPPVDALIAARFSHDDDSFASDYEWKSMPTIKARPPRDSS